MKTLEVRIPHGLEKPEVRRRLDAAVERARRDYSDKVSSLDAQWKTEDNLAVEFVVLGMELDGEVLVESSELFIRLHLPGMLSMFAGQVRTGIEERIGGLLGGPS